ncbi:MAG: NrfD/PsrC family molybdoenzyme membrane anchor subunit [bacterium]
MNKWIREKIFLGMTLGEYIKSLIAPFNIICGAILLAGLYVIILRFTQGLSEVTEGSNLRPLGLFIGFNMLCGVAMSAGGYCLGTTVYLLNRKDYYPLVRMAILVSFLGYFFAVVALLMDIGRPWRIYFPMFVSYGPTSVLFLVAWHVSLYLTVQFLEFCPAICEWLNLKRLRDWIERLTIGATIFGVILSTLHQSALGGLFLIAPNKLHPLWYSELIPILFFVSSIATGLSMTMIVSWLVRKKMTPKYLEKLDELTIGLGRAATVVLFCYLGLKIIGIAHSNSWRLLNTPWGLWFCLELFLIILPCYLFVLGVRKKNVGIIRFSAALTILGTIINRLNISIICFNWQLHDLHFPPLPELILSLSIITAWICSFRWIINRMPVLWEHKADN